MSVGHQTSNVYGAGPGRNSLPVPITPLFPALEHTTVDPSVTTPLPSAPASTDTAISLGGSQVQSISQSTDLDTSVTIPFLPAPASVDTTVTPGRSSALSMSPPSDVVTYRTPPNRAEPEEPRTSTLVSGRPKQRNFRKKAIELQLEQNDAGLLICPKENCNHIAVDFSLIITHIVDHVRDLPLDRRGCLFCKFVWDGRKSQLMSNHLLRHFPPSKKCRYEGCDFVTHMASTLKSHEKNQHESDAGEALEARTCSLCGEVLVSPYSLQRHLQVHEETPSLPVEALTCHICGKECATAPNLARHIKGHEKQITLVKCRCDKSFPAHRLRDHQARTCPLRPKEEYLCQERSCARSVPGKGYVNSNALWKHARSHRVVADAFDVAEQANLRIDISSQL